MSKMDKDIAFLIDALNEEKARLKELIQSSKEEHEFLIAHYHSEALGRASRQLQIIRKLDDRHYDTKKWLAASIKGYERLVGPESHEEMRAYLESLIERDKSELRRLTALKKVSSKESNTLNQYLAQLTEGKLSKFKIFLSRKDSLSLELKREEDQVALSIPNINEMIEAHVFFDEDIVKLDVLGFAWGNDNRLTATMNLDDNVLQKLKLLLCKIVFEVFIFEEFEGESSIEIEH